MSGEHEHTPGRHVEHWDEYGNNNNQCCEENKAAIAALNPRVQFVLYVDAVNGKDTNKGTQQKPIKTWDEIFRRLPATWSQCDVHLAAGTYPAANQVYVTGHVLGPANPNVVDNQQVRMRFFGAATNEIGTKTAAGGTTTRQVVVSGGGLVPGAHQGAVVRMTSGAAVDCELMIGDNDATTLFMQDSFNGAYGVVPAPGDTFVVERPAVIVTRGGALIWHSHSRIGVDWRRMKFAVGAFVPTGADTTGYGCSNVHIDTGFLGLNASLQGNDNGNFNPSNPLEQFAGLYVTNAFIQADEAGNSAGSGLQLDVVLRDCFYALSKHAHSFLQAPWLDGSNINVDGEGALDIFPTFDGFNGVMQNVPFSPGVLFSNRALAEFFNIDILDSPGDGIDVASGSFVTLGVVGGGSGPSGAAANVVAAPGFSGAAASIVAPSLSGDARVTGLTGMTPDIVGQFITISGAASAGNNGAFQVTDFVSASIVEISNGVAVVPDANNGAISWLVGSQLTGLVGITAGMVGQFIGVSGAASATNNGTFVIASVNSATSVNIFNAFAVTPDANNGAIVWTQSPIGGEGVAVSQMAQAIVSKTDTTITGAGGDVKIGTLAAQAWTSIPAGTGVSDGDTLCRVERL